jgi:hypothetical protein
MKRGLTTAEIVVVHTREIIVDKGVGVNQFKRAGSMKCSFKRDLIDFCCRYHESGAQAFATSKRCIAR